MPTGVCLLVPGNQPLKAVLDLPRGTQDSRTVSQGAHSQQGHGDHPYVQ
jgi:hypothetical protein